MEGFHDGAIQKVIKRYLNGECGRQDKRFAPSLAEFTTAVREENKYWNGTEPRRLLSDSRATYAGDPDLETKQERWRRIGRKAIAEHGKGKALALSLQSAPDDEH